MSREQKRNRRRGRKKQRRNRKFWRVVTSNRYEKMLGMARRFTRDISDAHDLAQTVVFRLLKYCPKPVRIVDLDAYIFVSTRNAWRDLQRWQREVPFSELKKADSRQVAVLDPNLESFLNSCDIKALAPKTKTNDPNLLRTKILLEAGFKLPAIAKKLNEPVRQTRYRWYKYRDIQRKAVLGKPLRLT